MIGFIEKKKILAICGAALLSVGITALLFNAHRQEDAIAIPPGRIHCAGVFGGDIVVHDSSGGEIVIGNMVARGDVMPSTANITTDPETVWTANTHAGRHTPADMAQMRSGNIGVLTIPDIGLTVNVYESADNDHIEAMEKGVAHFHHTSAWYGNVSLPAHNVNFDGSPGFFLNIHQLQIGALITYQTALGVREYAVESIVEVNENDWSKLGWTDDNRLTLVTCITGRPNMRLIVQAVERMQS